MALYVRNRSTGRLERRSSKPIGGGSAFGGAPRYSGGDATAGSGTSSDPFRRVSSGGGGSPNTKAENDALAREAQEREELARKAAETEAAIAQKTPGLIIAQKGNVLNDVLTAEQRRRLQLLNREGKLTNEVLTRELKQTARERAGRTVVVSSERGAVNASAAFSALAEKRNAELERERRTLARQTPNPVTQSPRPESASTPNKVRETSFERAVRQQQERQNKFYADLERAKKTAGNLFPLRVTDEDAPGAKIGKFIERGGQEVTGLLAVAPLGIGGGFGIALDKTSLAIRGLKENPEATKAELRRAEKEFKLPVKRILTFKDPNTGEFTPESIAGSSLLYVLPALEGAGAFQAARAAGKPVLPPKPFPQTKDPSIFGAYRIRQITVNEQGATGSLPAGLDLAKVLPRQPVANPQRVAEGFDPNFVFPTSRRVGIDGKPLPQESQLLFGTPKQTGTQPGTPLSGGGSLRNDPFPALQGTRADFPALRAGAEAGRNRQLFPEVLNPRLTVRRTESGKLIIDEGGALPPTPAAKPQAGSTGPFNRPFQRSLEEYQPILPGRITDPSRLLEFNPVTGQGRAFSNRIRVANEPNPFKRLFIDRRGTAFGGQSSVTRQTPSTTRLPQNPVIPGTGLLKPSVLKTGDTLRSFAGSPQFITTPFSAGLAPTTSLGSKSSQSTPQTPISSPKSVLEELQEQTPAFRFKDAVRERQLPQSIQKLDLEQEQRGGQRSRITTVQLTEAPPLFDQPPIEETVPRTRIPPTIVTRTPPQRPADPPPRVLFPPPTTPDTPTTPNPFGGFDVLVRRRGRFQKVSYGALSKAEAIKFGTAAVGTTAAATFKIRPSKSQRQQRFKGRGTPLSNFARKGNIFVEKREKRITTRGELQEITFKGIAATKSKKRKSPFALAGGFKNVFGRL